MELKLYQIDPKSVPTEEKIHLSLNHPLVYEGLTLDFKNGTITCTRTKAYKIVEYVAFSFSVALLYNLCVPRSKLTPENESLSLLKAAGLLYSTPYHFYSYYNYGANVCARCTARHSVPEACDIELDQSRSAIISNNGELGGDKGSHEHNGDGNDKGGSDCKNVGSAGGQNGQNVSSAGGQNGVVGVVCGNDRFRDGGRGGRNGEVDYYCGGRSGVGGGCGGGGCRGGGACGGGCGGGGCGGGGGGCGGCGCD